MLKIAGIIKESFVDGDGIRYVVFTQGCEHNCIGCHNPKTHNPDDGFFIETDKIIKDIKKNPLLSGITISGGEPFLQTKRLISFLKLLKENDINVWLYSGYTIEEIQNDSLMNEALQYIDVLVDGPFVLDKKNPELRFRGSENQRIIKL